MTGRRQHHDGPGDRTDGDARRDRVDPWDALGPDDPTPTSNVADEFWGDLPDWSATASTSRRSGRRRIGAADDEPIDPTPIGAPTPTRRVGIVETIRGAWDGLLGGSPDATREHRRLDVTPAAAPSPVDEWDDDWDDWGELDEFERDRSIGTAPTEHPDSQTEDPDESPVAGLERGWIAEAAASRDRRPGIDPLLARLGAVVIVACLLVPLLIAATRSSDLTDGASGALTSDGTTTAPTDVLTTTPASSTAATTADVPVEPLDPASLPPAVPVNTEPSTSAAASTPDRSDVNDVASDASTDPNTTTAPSTSTSSDTRSESEPSSDALPEVDEPAAADDPAARVDPPVCPISYTVVAGDFWIRLADAAGVELAELLEVNRATADTPLFAGSEICLPAGAETPPPPTTAPPTTAPPTTTPPTTAPPTTTPPTTTSATTPQEEPPGPEDIKQIVRDVWPDDLEDRALEIVYIESRFVPTAKNFCCYGLFQIYWEVHDVWLADLGITSATQLYDPETNARAALALYERAGGWGPWGF